MAQDIKLWKIVDGKILSNISKARVDLEMDVEKWIIEDVSIVDDNLLVIGEQVDTGYNGYIDLLCVDLSGDIVILELKRDKTPRDIVAQTLDYASCVKGFSEEKIIGLAEDYWRKRDDTFEEAFKQKFDADLPDVLNENHRMLIVAAKVDEGSERIIKYLSDEHGLDINAVTFQYFKEEGEEILGRVFLIEPEEVKKNVKKSGRRPPLTYKELSDIAEGRQVGDIYKELEGRLPQYFDTMGTTRSTICYIGHINDSRTSMFSLFPGESSPERGLKFKVYRVKRVAEYFGVNKEDIINLLPEETKEIKFTGEKDSRTDDSYLLGYFKDAGMAKSFVDKIKNLKNKNSDAGIIPSQLPEPEKLI